MEANERIKELRLNAGLTQEELGAKLGVQKSAIAKWENGRVKNLKSKYVLAMANVFGVSPSYVMAMDSNRLEEDMVKVSEKTYTLTEDEEAMLAGYSELSDEGKAELMKHLQLLKKVFLQEE